MAHLVGFTGDDASNGGDTGAGAFMGLAPDFDEHRHRELSEVRIEPAQAAGFVHQFLPEDRLAAVLWRPRARREGCRVAAGMGWGLPPAVEGAAADCKSIAGGGDAVGLPEAQDFDSLLGLRAHAPTMPHFGDVMEPLYSVSNRVDLHGISSWVEVCHMYLSLCSTE